MRVEVDPTVVDMLVHFKSDERAITNVIESRVEGGGEVRVSKLCIGIGEGVLVE
jgi:hypothetical protein